MIERSNAVQNAGPRGFEDEEAEGFPAYVSAHARGDRDGLERDPRSPAALPTAEAGLAVGRLERDLGERLLREVSVGERGDLGVEVGADPVTLSRGGPGVRAQRLH